MSAAERIGLATMTGTARLSRLVRLRLVVGEVLRRRLTLDLRVIILVHFVVR